jgi:NAD-dependent dihydropyrimidine dehydrogenase PreA subunit
MSSTEFIRVGVNMNTCAGIARCGEGCVRVCPVGIFQKNGDAPPAVAENEDEGILCEPGLQASKPQATTITKRNET